MKRALTIVGCLALALLLGGCGEEITSDQPLNDAAIKAAQAVIGQDMTAAERKQMRGELEDARASYAQLRGLHLVNGERPAPVISTDRL